MKIMEKKYFQLNSVMARFLLDTNKEEFIAKFNKEFFLCSNAIHVIFPLLSDNARKRFVLDAEFEKHCAKDIHSTLVSFFSVDEVNELFAQKGLFAELKEIRCSSFDKEFSDQLRTLVFQGKFLDEICEYSKPYGMGLEYLIEAGYYDVLEKHEAWEALKYCRDSRSLDILLRNKQYDLILNAATSEGLQILYDNGFKDVIVEYCLRPETEIKREHIRVLYSNGCWSDFKGKLKLALFDYDVLASLAVLAFQEQQGRKITEDMKFLYDYSKKYEKEHVFPNPSNLEVAVIERVHSCLCNVRYCRIYAGALYDLEIFPSKKSLDIWMYKNIENDNFRKELLKKYRWNYLIRRKMKDSKFPTTLKEICKLMNKC